MHFEDCSLYSGLFSDAQNAPTSTHIQLINPNQLGPKICQPCFLLKPFLQSFQISDRTLKDFQFFLGLSTRNLGMILTFPLKKSFQMQVKLPSLLLRVRVFWQIVIKQALFPATLWRMKVMWKQPIFLCHPVNLEAWALLCTHSLLGIQTTCHSQVCWETT